MFRTNVLYCKKIKFINLAGDFDNCIFFLILSMLEWGLGTEEAIYNIFMLLYSLRTQNWHVAHKPAIIKKSTIFALFFEIWLKWPLISWSFWPSLREIDWKLWILKKKHISGPHVNFGSAYIRRGFKWECIPGLNQPYKACRSGLKL